MYLTDHEKETLITFTEGDHVAYIATYNTAIKLALRRFCKHYPCGMKQRRAEKPTALIKAGCPSAFGICFCVIMRWVYCPTCGRRIKSNCWRKAFVRQITI